jgi:hypothetical protein
MLSVSAEFSDVPHAIGYADSPAGLLPIIRGIPASYPAATEADLAWLEDGIQHEAQHAAAATVLGCSSRFCITMTPLPGGGVHARPCCSWVSRRPLSKLAIASIAAAPSDPSPDDLADLRRMGYRDADDVAERIRRFNRRARYPLPLPAGAQNGYRGGARGWRRRVPHLIRRRLFGGLTMSTTENRIPELRVRRGVSHAVTSAGLILGTFIAVLAMTNGLRLRLGGMPELPGVVFGALLVWALFVAAAFLLAEMTRRHHKTAARYAARQGSRGASAGGQALRRQALVLFEIGVAWAGPRWHTRTTRTRSAPDDVTPAAPVSPSADNAEVSQPEGEDMTTPLSGRGRVSRIAPDRRARRVASRTGGPISTLWAALERRALDFDPEGEGDYLDYLNEDTVGISALAEANVEVYGGMTNDKGADPQAVAAFHDYADALVHAAEMATAAKKAWTERYELPRESAAEGVQMTHDGRFITGEGD